MMCLAHLVPGYGTMRYDVDINILCLIIVIVQIQFQLLTPTASGCSVARFGCTRTQCQLTISRAGCIVDVT